MCEGLVELDMQIIFNPLFVHGYSERSLKFFVHQILFLTLNFVCFVNKNHSFGLG